MTRIFCFSVALLASLVFTDVAASDNTAYSNICVTSSQFPNDGTYTRTNSSVSVYTESGHSKGSFAVYLHGGKRYINFNRTWICIQGKSRFAYNGNWYVIK